MKSNNFAPQWRSRRDPLRGAPLVFCLTLIGLGLFLGLNPSPSQADEVVDPADPAANYEYEDESQINYQEMDKDDYQNSDNYDYQDENKLKSENDNQEGYQNEDSEDYRNMNQLDYKEMK
jgi:hypothetical protein